MDKLGIVNKLLGDNRLIDLFILSRYLYKVGEDLIDDSTYRSLENFIKENNLSPLVNQSYDDDEIPLELLKEFHLEYLNLNFDGTSSPYYNYLDEEKSTSIKPLESYYEAYQYFRATPNERKIFMPKCDGIMTKTLFRKENPNEDLKLLLALTRGRSGNSFDITKNMAKISPITVKSDSEEVIVYGEGLVDWDYFDKIPKGGDYSEKYTSPKSAANSMLRVDNIPNIFYKYLHRYAFNASGLSNTISKTLDILKEQGFDTVPYMIVEPKEVPESIDEFTKWLKEKLKYFWNISKELNLKTDGVVVEIDDKNFVGELNTIYNSRNCALKFDYWSAEYYVGIVKNIIVEQQTEEASVIVEIEPLVTSDNNTATRITSYNPSWVIDLNLEIGKEVYFKRKGSAINVILSGAELYNVLVNPHKIQTSNNF